MNLSYDEKHLAFLTSRNKLDCLIDGEKWVWYPDESHRMNGWKNLIVSEQKWMEAATRVNFKNKWRELSETSNCPFSIHIKMAIEVKWWSSVSRTFHCHLRFLSTIISFQFFIIFRFESSFNALSSFQFSLFNIFSLCRAIELLLKTAKEESNRYALSNSDYPYDLSWGIVFFIIFQKLSESYFVQFKPPMFRYISICSSVIFKIILSTSKLISVSHKLKWHFCLLCFPIRRINLRDYFEVVEKINEGGFGTIYKGTAIDWLDNHTVLYDAYSTVEVDHWSYFMKSMEKRIRQLLQLHN